jgi:hypothetical protein
LPEDVQPAIIHKKATVYSPSEDPMREFKEGLDYLDE